MTDLPQKNTLILGGTGGIGSECAKLIDNATILGSRHIDLDKTIDIDLSPYEAVIFAAGVFGGRGELTVNFLAPVELIFCAEEQDWKGNMVFFTSPRTTYYDGRFAMYAASKAALNAYLEARHDELADQGIIINTIAPARTDSPIQRQLYPDVNPSLWVDARHAAIRAIQLTDTADHGRILHLGQGIDTHV